MRQDEVESGFGLSQRSIRLESVESGERGASEGSRKVAVDKGPEELAVVAEDVVEKRARQGL